MSEWARAKYRLAVEVSYLLVLAREKHVPLREFTHDEEVWLLGLVQNFSPTDAEGVAKIETEGTAADEVRGIPARAATKHDVKALEYWLRDKMGETTLRDCAPWVHFALTSEDINSVALACMLHDAVHNVVLPALQKVEERLAHMANEYASLAMLARTHGQAATPTTWGKEMRVYSERLRAQRERIEQVVLTCKLSGATGGWNAHVVALPEVEWVRVSGKVVQMMNKTLPTRLEQTRADEDILKPTRTIALATATTQIDSHDTVAELGQALHTVLSVCTDCAQDYWRYISDGWVVQKVEAGAVGSSTMPHKVNPIQFENAEGNIAVAQAYFEMYARKLPVSRLQRDLSDSTVLRTLGMALGHTLLALTSLSRGLDSCAPHEVKMREALRDAPEVLTEAVQTVLRMYGKDDAYEGLKELSRGKKITLESLREYMRACEIPDEAKKRLLTLTPETYTGLSEQIAHKINK